MATGGSNGHRRPARGCGNPARQHGSMAVAMLLMLLALISILGLVEVGYLYWGKRETQKVADLAALSGVQQLQTCASDNSDNAAARGNATTDNNFTGTLAIQCGHWDPTQAGDDPAHPDQHFVASASPVNAVRVTATMPLTPIFGITDYSGVSSTAVATANPIAAFSVGSSLLGVDPSSPLGNLLSSTLGTQLGLNLLTYNGIAGVDVSLLGIIKNLKGPDGSPIEVGTVDDVLNAPITVGGFLKAYVQALQGDPQAATVSLDFENQVEAIAATLGDIPLNLGSILNVNANTTDPTAALNTSVSALDILNAVLLAADSQNAVALPSATVSVPGVAQVGVQLSVVEPPQIAVGGVGTTAHTAQIRLALDVSVLGGNPLTGGQSLLDIPLYLEVAPTDATITAIQCGVQGSDGSVANDVTIKTSPGVLNAFLGKLGSGAINNTSQSWSSIIADGTPAPLVSVSVLGLPVATLDASSNVSLTAIPAMFHTFSVDPDVPMSQQSGMTWPPPDTPQPPQLGNVLGSLLTSNTLKTKLSLLGGDPGSIVDALLNGLLQGLVGTLQPLESSVFAPLDTALIGPLLQVAGVQLGTAEVNLRAVQCNGADAQLVY